MGRAQTAWRWSGTRIAATNCELHRPSRRHRRRWCQPSRSPRSLPHRPRRARRQARRRHRCPDHHPHGGHLLGGDVRGLADRGVARRRPGSWPQTWRRPVPDGRTGRSSATRRSRPSRAETRDSLIGIENLAGSHTYTVTVAARRRTYVGSTQVTGAAWPLVVDQRSESADAPARRQSRRTRLGASCRRTRRWSRRHRSTVQPPARCPNERLHRCRHRPWPRPGPSPRQPDGGVVGVDALVVLVDPAQPAVARGRPPGDDADAATALDRHVSHQQHAGRDPLADQLEQAARLGDGEAVLDAPAGPNGRPQRPGTARCRGPSRQPRRPPRAAGCRRGRAPRGCRRAPRRSWHGSRPGPARPVPPRSAAAGTDVSCGAHGELAQSYGGAARAPPARRTSGCSRSPGRPGWCAGAATSPPRCGAAP